MPSEQVKDESLTRIDHESRVLLNDIIGMTEILMDEPFSAEQMRSLTMIRSSARKLLALLQGNSDFSQGLAIEQEADTVEQDDEPSSEATNNLAQAQKLMGCVLVAEDNKTNQVAMKKMLEKLGLEVIVANDGREAIEKVHQQSFDLIFMDIGMPYFDGYHTTRALREQGIRVPIIVVTGQEMKYDGEECIRAGCNEYLAKPVTRVKLQMMIDKYLRKPD